MKFIKVVLLLIFISLNSFSQWSPTNGPYGGMIQAFAVDSQRVYASINSHLYSSVDSGTTWMQFGTEMCGLLAKCITLDGSNIWIGTSKGPVLSTDNGLTWTILNNGILNTPNNSINSIVTYQSKIFAAGPSGVYISTDLGQTWTRKVLGMYSTETNVLIIKDSTLFAGTHFGFAKSINFGNTWQSFTTSPYQVPQVRKIILRSNIVTCGTDMGTYDFDLNTLTHSYAGGNIGTADLIHDGTAFYGASYGIYRSYIGYDYYQSCAPDLQNFWVNKLIKFRNRFIISTIYGIYVSDDNLATCSRSNFGLLNSSITSFFSNNDTLFACTTIGDIYTTTDDGQAWSINYDQLGTNYPIFANTDSFLFVVNSQNTLLKSSDNGANWSIINCPTLNIYTGIIPNGNKILGLTQNNKLVQSPDYGITWDTLAINYLPSTATKLLFVSDTLFAGTYGGVYSTTLIDSNWHQMNTGLVDTICYEFIQVDGKLFYTTYPQGQYVSTDLGHSWSQTNNGIPAGSQIVKMYYDDTLLFAAVNDTNNVYISSDKGQSFSAYPTNLCLKGINNFIKHNGSIFASNSGNGVWKADMSVILGTTSLPFQNKLEIYPNPSSGKFRFKNNNVNCGTLSIYSIDGKIQLFKNKFSTDEVIDLTDKPNGIYFIKITSDGIVRNAKAIKY